MATILKFRLKLRAQAPKRRRRAKARDVLIPFPFCARHHLVQRHARAMLTMSDEEADTYLTTVLEGVCEDLGRIGVDCETNNMIFEFADAIGKAMFGPDFNLKAEGAGE